MNSPDVSRGISAVLLGSQARAVTLLDLAAVLQGLASSDFEIIIVGDPESSLADISASAPRLPLRLVPGKSLEEGFDSALYDLICVCARDGRFDLRQLNHLLEAVDDGADLAIGYRPRRSDGIVRRLRRWGWRVELDCAFAVFHRAMRHDLRRARELGYRVVDLPVSHRRPTIGAPTAAHSPAA
jgi:hypothetical protein